MKVVQSQIMNLLMKEKRVEEEELLKTLSISAKLLQKNMKELENYLSCNDLGKITFCNGCYSLSLNGFGAAYSVIRKYTIKDNEKELRIFSIVAILLKSTDYITIQFLADELFLSSRQISYELVKVREFLGKHNLILKSVPHHGLVIEGSELNKRVCFSDVVSNLLDIHDSEIIAREKIKVIRNLLFKILQEFQYIITDYSFENLVIHLYIAVLRVEANFLMEDFEPYFAFDQRIENIAKKIVKTILSVGA